ncbi:MULTISPECIES: universal stress protein [Arenibacter]|uniref:universal stress protein n=1 Tax=Arenibacter TaxID=178469 RepID=UPI0004DF9D94|nr:MULTISPECIES: universal stress protein [Arenibacter]GBF20332.1 universal stress protein family protein [Arenibacter sp. NBRC 103722]|tara:strand:+ start:57 stop:896 length:840 start_codon:yes stop_codon:yes gene_type:complete
MKRRILCPTDFSKNAQNAIEYAVKLFKNETCVFYILNTYNAEPYTMELAIARDLEEFREKSIGGLRVILEWLSHDDNSRNHEFHVVSECGNLLDIIKTMVDKQDIEMVVMGTQGATNSRIEIFGSQTVLAMEEIRNCPVLAIPSKTIYKEIKEIVFPTDYRTTFKRREFQYLVDIAKMSNSSIVVLNVVNKNESLDEDQVTNKNLLKDYFEDLDYSFHTLKNKDVQAAINSFIESRGSDMVSFINRRHSFFGMILSRPMVKNLNYHTGIPVLALHEIRR